MAETTFGSYHLGSKEATVLGVDLRKVGKRECEASFSYSFESKESSLLLLIQTILSDSALGQNKITSLHILRCDDWQCRPFQLILTLNPDSDLRWAIRLLFAFERQNYPFRKQLPA